MADLPTLRDHIDATTAGTHSRARERRRQRRAARVVAIALLTTAALLLAGYR